MHQPIQIAVIPVAGLGTRFLPATKAIPKEMLPVLDRPLIQYAVDEAREAGIESFIFITAQGKTAIEDHFDTSFTLETTLLNREKRAELAVVQTSKLESGQAIYIRQREPKGLGHAVWCARHLLGSRPFALILPDDLIVGPESCLKQMVREYAHLGGNLVAVMDVPRDQVQRYGIIDIAQKKGNAAVVKGVIEKPNPEAAPSTTAIVGRYILQSEIFGILEKQPVGIGGEIQLTDAFPSLIGKQPFHGFHFVGERFDCGTKEGWLEANIAMAYARPDLRSHLLEAIRRHVKEKG